jgi:hypothetical protein
VNELLLGVGDRHVCGNLLVELCWTYPPSILRPEKLTNVKLTPRDRNGPKCVEPLHLSRHDVRVPR